jgi:methylase of polypeptide subunit release factors
LNNRRKYDHCLEWCAGLGAIGYSILDAGLCERITFMDLYEPAKKIALINARDNNILDKVNFYHVDAIYKLPTDLKFDLVVANPPHSMNELEFLESVLPSEKIDSARMTVDINWNIHREFFSNIKSYLTPDADVFLSESSIIEEHIVLAQENDLRFIEAFPAPKLAKDSNSDAVLMHYKL